MITSTPIDESLARYRFLIIGGTSKAATTSLFHYLSAHPQVCASRAKETRFFLDGDYPLKSEMRYELHGAARYLSFYESHTCKNERQWRLEATPDYLYSPRAAANIRGAIEHATIVFILREPVARLMSWYQFGQSIGEIPAAMTFDDYVAAQARNGREMWPTFAHPAFGALQHGLYSRYVARFVDVFGPAAVQVVFHEQLAANPVDFMKNLCVRLKIDSVMFERYSFVAVNRSVSVRSAVIHRKYMEVSQKCSEMVPEVAALRSLLRPLRRVVVRMYEGVNVGASSRPVVSGETGRFLRSYYSSEAADLERVAGVRAPWSFDNK